MQGETRKLFVAILETIDHIEEELSAIKKRIAAYNASLVASDAASEPEVSATGFGRAEDITLPAATFPDIAATVAALRKANLPGADVDLNVPPLVIAALDAAVEMGAKPPVAPPSPEDDDGGEPTRDPDAGGQGGVVTAEAPEGIGTSH